MGIPSHNAFMIQTSSRFVQLASVVTDRVAELLYAPVFVTNERGVVVTSSEPDRVGRSITPLGNCEASNWDGKQALSHFLRIPLQHDTETGEVIVGKPADREMISPRLAQALVELVINQSTQHHLPSQHELKNELIDDLLHDRIEDETIIWNRAKRLGIDLSPPRAVILIDAACYILPQMNASGMEAVEIEQRRAQVVISSIVSFFHLPNDTICAYLGEGEVAVLKASNSKNLGLWADCNDVAEGLSSSWANLAALKRAADALLLRLRNDMGATINVGIGRYHPGVRGLARSYEDAGAALSLGKRLQGDNQVHCLGELGIAAFVGVADEETKIDLAKYLLSPLDHEPELLVTLNTFFAENCCPSTTAKQLSIHRNTLSYRLDKIASLTGLEPRKFDDAVQMRLCLLLRSLQSQNSYR
ncbi:helix-turn-helix domain-containing protein [Leptolyngbya sp. GB1-A1]|uniref:helix-turn-helix domain-containing protein n=2 Tax=Leptolyngbya TaxID=47251 RepID=UPI003299640C